MNKKVLLVGGVGVLAVGYLYISKKKSTTTSSSTATSSGEILVPTATPASAQTSIVSNPSGMNYPGNQPNIYQIAPGLVLSSGPGGNAYYEPLSTASANPTVFG